MNQMYKNYLTKNNFWKSGDNWYVTHNALCGGIYAKLLQRGVEIHYNNEKRTFTNFLELDNFLDRISAVNQPTNNGNFISILNRKMASKMLRSLPI
ncbi:MAG: hypothetical protein ACTSWY_14630 [Promethearchaeota archaeon]